MAVEFLGILDTAVKIGLGALISGVATYRVSKLNHDNDLLKSKLVRERQLLEEIAGQVEEFSNAVLKYWAYMIEHVRYVTNKTKAPEDLESRIENAAKEIFDAFSKLSSAEGKLILLRAEDSQQLLREYGEFVKCFRRSAWPGNKLLKESDLDDYRNEILAKRKDLYKSLRDAYSK